MSQLDITFTGETDEEPSFDAGITTAVVPVGERLDPDAGGDMTPVRIGDFWDRRSKLWRGVYREMGLPVEVPAEATSREVDAAARRSAISAAVRETRLDIADTAGVLELVIDVPAPAFLIDRLRDVGCELLTGGMVEALYRSSEIDHDDLFLGSLICHAAVTSTGRRTADTWDLAEMFADEIKAVDWSDIRLPQVLLLRTGLTQRSLTLEEIGAQLKVTRERVRQLEKKGTRKVIAEGAAFRLLGEVVRRVLRMRGTTTTRKLLTAQDIGQRCGERGAQILSVVAEWNGCTSRELLAHLWWPVEEAADLFAVSEDVARGVSSSLGALRERLVASGFPLSFASAMEDINGEGVFEALQVELVDVTYDSAGNLVLRDWLRGDSSQPAQWRILGFCLERLGGEASADQLAEELEKIPSYRSAFGEEIGTDELRARIISVCASRDAFVYRGRSTYAFATQQTRRLFVREFVERVVREAGGTLSVVDLREAARQAGYNLNSVMMVASGMAGGRLATKAGWVEFIGEPEAEEGQEVVGDEVNTGEEEELGADDFLRQLGFRD